MRIEQQLAELGGIASARDLVPPGVRRDKVERAAAAGRIVRLRRGWYALPSAPPQLRAARAVGGTLTCVSALAARGVWTLRPAGMPSSSPSSAGLHVAVPPGVRAAPGSGTVIHRQAASGHLADPHDALGWAMRCLPFEEAVVVTDSCLSLGLVREEMLPALAGTAQARRVAAWADGRAESGLESLARVRLRSCGIRTRPQTRIEGVGRVDLLIGDRLILELDGERWHSDAASRQRDRARDRQLVLSGYRVLRAGYREVVDGWPELEAQIRTLVRSDRHRMRGTRA